MPKKTKQFQPLKVCPVCKQNLVPADCTADHPVGLIVGESPSDEDRNLGIPWFGVTGRILGSEMRRVGLSADEFWLTNLWLHNPNESEHCLRVHCEELVKLSQLVPIVMVMGATLSETFLNRPLYSVSGIQTTSVLVGKTPIIAAPNPAELLHGSGLGELRFALNTLAEFVDAHRSKTK